MAVAVAVAVAIAERPREGKAKTLIETTRMCGPGRQSARLSSSRSHCSSCQSSLPSLPEIPAPAPRLSSERWSSSLSGCPAARSLRVLERHCSDLASACCCPPGAPANAIALRLRKPTRLAAAGPAQSLTGSYQSQTNHVTAPAEGVLAARAWRGDGTHEMQRY